MESPFAPQSAPGVTAGGVSALTCRTCGGDLMWSSVIELFFCPPCRRRSLAQYDDPQQLQLVPDSETARIPRAPIPDGFRERSGAVKRLEAAVKHSA